MNDIVDESESYESGRESDENRGGRVAPENDKTFSGHQLFSPQSQTTRNSISLIEISSQDSLLSERGFIDTHDDLCYQHSANPGISLPVVHVHSSSGSVMSES